MTCEVTGELGPEARLQDRSSRQTSASRKHEARLLERLTSLPVVASSSGSVGLMDDAVQDLEALKFEVDRSDSESHNRA